MTESDSPKSNLTADQLIEKLRRALKRNGDFPASAKIVSELRQLTSDPKVTASQVTEVILREPSLGVRVLHLVNSSFYRRAKPIMTVSQAVVQIGMRPLAEMCSGLVLLQKFVPAARRDGAFANVLRKTVVTSLLASSITPSTAANKSQRKEEYGYLAGSFAELGTMLLAFYFPQIYDTAVKRAEAKHQDVSQSIKELTGLSPLSLSMEVLEALELPGFYKDILSEAEKCESRPEISGETQSEVQRLACAVCAAKNISEVIVNNKSKQQLEAVCAEVSQKFKLDSSSLNKVMAELPKVFIDHCSSIDLQLPPLPEFVSGLSETTGKGGAAAHAGGTEGDGNFNQFVNEIRQAVENREPTASVITSVMETFAWSLRFDRILLMLLTSQKNRLVGRMMLGNLPGTDPKRIERPLASATGNCPAAVAFKQSRPVFTGEPIFEGGWPFAVIPIGFGPRAIGVIYADRKDSSGGELAARDQAAIGILAELLDRSLALQT